MKTFIAGFNYDYIPEQDRYLFARKSPSFRFNIIGTGTIGQEHMRVTELEGRATIHGIYDPNPSSVAAASQTFAQCAPGQQLIVYDSLPAACNDPDADALLICTPNYTHIDVIREAVRSGKHILLEKPMATSIADAYEITQLARQHNTILQIGLQYRYKAIYAEAIHEILQRSVIGDVKTISIVEHRLPFLDKVGQWNKFSRYSGGTLVEKCCHYFDLLNLFAQSKPVTVYASGSMAVNFLEFNHHQQSADILDNAMVTVVYANGVRANFQLCMFAPMFYEELVVCGNAGRLKAFENEDFLPGGGLTTGLEVLCGEQQASRKSTPCYPDIIESSGHHGATYFEHVNFVEQLQGRQTSCASVEDGFWSVVIGAAAEQSIKTSAIVEIAQLLQDHNINYK